MKGKDKKKVFSIITASIMAFSLALGYVDAKDRTTQADTKKAPELIYWTTDGFDLALKFKSEKPDITEFKVKGKPYKSVDLKRKYRGFGNELLYYYDHKAGIIFPNQKELRNQVPIQIKVKEGYVYEYTYNSRQRTGQTLVAKVIESPMPSAPIAKPAPPKPAKPAPVPAPAPVPQPAQPAPTRPEPSRPDPAPSLSQPELSQDLEIVDQVDLALRFSLKLKNPKQVSLVKGLKINHVPYTLKESKHQTFTGGYFVENDGTIHIQEPQDQDLITIVGESNKLWHFRYNRHQPKGSRITKESDQEKIKEKFVKLRLVGSFEAAVINQKKYDGISGASSSLTANKNSNVKLQFAEVDSEVTEPKDADWKDLHTRASLGERWTDRKVVIGDGDSGMVGVYNRLDSSVTLRGIPSKIGSYKIKVSVKEYNGKIIESNELPFNVYSQNEKLFDRLKLEYAKPLTHGDKLSYDMEPWLIQDFGGEKETVTVPKEIKLIFGSHLSGTYGELGRHSKTGTTQTLIVGKDTDLSLVNMKVKSSVKIIVKEGGKLNLNDSSMYGEIVVEKGGSFSMNYDSHHQKYLTGSSIQGKLILEDGAKLDSSLIYSNTNFLTDAGVNGTANKNSDPVVEVRGNVEVVGDVFIRGDEAATGTDPKTKKTYAGQAALRVTDGKLSVAKGKTLALYGAGKIATTTHGGAALILENGEVAGEGSLIAIGGSGFWGDGGHAISGKGKLTIAKAILRGGHVNDDSTPGEGYTEGVEVARETIGKSTSGKSTGIDVESESPSYWRGTTAPDIKDVDYGDKPINPSGKTREELADQPKEEKKEESEAPAKKPAEAESPAPVETEEADEKPVETEKLAESEAPATPAPAETAPAKKPVETETPAVPAPAAPAPAVTVSPAAPVLAAPATTEKRQPKILEGSSLTLERGEDLVIKTEADLSTFEALKINGELVSSEHYSLRSGSTIVTVRSSYLATLPAGEHKVEIVARANDKFDSSVTMVKFMLSDPKKEEAKEVTEATEATEATETSETEVKDEEALAHTGETWNNMGLILLALALASLLLKLRSKE